MMDMHHSHAEGARPTCSCHHQQPKILHSLLTPMTPRHDTDNCHSTPKTDRSFIQQPHSPATASMGIHQALLKTHLQGKLHNYPHHHPPSILNGVPYAALPTHSMQVMSNRAEVPAQLANHHHFSHSANIIHQQIVDNYSRMVREPPSPVSPSLPPVNHHYRQRSGSTSSCGSNSSSGSSVSSSRISHGYSVSSMSDRHSPSPYSPFIDLDSGYASSTSSSPGASVDSDAYPVAPSPTATREAPVKYQNFIGRTQEQSQNIESSKLYHMLRGEGLSGITGRPSTIFNKSVSEMPQQNLSSNGFVCKKRPHEREPTYQGRDRMEQDGPIDLTCKRPRIEPQPRNENCESRHSNQSEASFQSNQQMSAKSSPLPPCSPEIHSGKSTPSLLPQSRSQTPLTAGSMLKQLLSCRDNDFHQANEDDVDEIESDIQTFASSNTPVTIAKKNLFPVSARVSDWVVKVVQYATSLPEFSNLTHNDKVTLLLNSWARIMLVQMAETNFQFAVTPVVGDKNGESKEGPASAPSSAETPTMSSVETIQSFIKKCQSMGLDNQEFSFIKSAALFNSGYSGVLDNMSYVEEVNSCFRQSIQDYIRSTPKGQLVRYSQILMCLPTLFGINCKMVEKLFCKHITGNMDMQVLLKEMLQNI